MKYIDTGTVMEYHPENEGDRERLREMFPHLKDYQYVSASIMACLGCGERYVPGIEKHQCDARRQMLFR